MYIITTNLFRYFEDGGAQSVSHQHLPNKIITGANLKTVLEFILHCETQGESHLQPHMLQMMGLMGNVRLEPTMVFSSLVAVQVVISLRSILNEALTLRATPLF